MNPPEDPDKSVEIPHGSPAGPDDRETGLPLLIFDNIPKGSLISCPSIEKSLTTEIYSDRVLGASVVRHVPAYTIMTFTGNNVEPRGDTPVFSLTSSKLSSDCPTVPAGRRRLWGFASTQPVDNPYNLKELLDALRGNRFAREGNNVGKEVKVIIADTGVKGAGNNGPFTQEVFDYNPPFELIAKAMRPNFDDPEEEAEHGTAVASIILGGPLFARIQAAERARIKLIIKKIFDKADGQKRSSPATNWITTIVNAAEGSSGIVNLSIKSKTEPFKFVNRERGPLFVVAAGNDGVDLGTEQFFPASWGGLGKVNLITVGASVVDGGQIKLAAFSNRSPRYVDIAAPGCNVPALSFSASTWAEKPVTGTSFSAPMVSFAAAMIMTEVVGGIDASDVKRRVLASADLHSSLENDVDDGRALNLIKALSLYKDLVEVDTGQYVKGNASFFGLSPVSGKRQTLEIMDLTCNGIKKPIDMKKIYKIRPNYQGKNGTKTIVYYQGNSLEVFQRLECDFPSDLKIQVRDKDESILLSESIGNIVDFVPRYRAFPY
jgi:subtilisin family serine protease